MNNKLVDHMEWIKDDINQYQRFQMNVSVVEQLKMVIFFAKYCVFLGVYCFHP